MQKDLKDSWWEKWSKADLLEKEELVKGLPFVRSFQSLEKLPDELRENVLAMQLNSFFLDLEEYSFFGDCSGYSK